MIPVKGKEPGAFVLTSKKDGKKYVMSEATFNQMMSWLSVDSFDKLFTGEWVVLDEVERKLAKEIRQKYFM